MTRGRSRPSVRGPLAAAALGASFLAACGAGGGAVATKGTGVAIADGPVAGASVSLTDASSPPRQRRASTGADGSFSLDLGGLAPPFLLAVEPGAAGQGLHALAEGAGNLDVNPLTDLAFAYAAGAGGAPACAESGAGQRRVIAVQARAVLGDLATAIAPLLRQYGIASLRADRAAVRRLLQDVKVTHAGGALTLTNRRTGGVIYAGALANPAAGVFDPRHLPGATGGTSSGGTTSGGSSGGSSSGGGSTSGGATSGGTASNGAAGGASSGGTASGSSGASSSGSSPPSAFDFPAGHEPLAPGATCLGCHGGTSSGGAGSSGASSGSTSGSASGTTSGATSGPASGSTSGATSGATPDAPGIDLAGGARLFVARCARCHGALGDNPKAGATAAQIVAKHPDLATSDEAAKIAAVLLVTTCPGGIGGGGSFGSGLEWSCSVSLAEFNGRGLLFRSKCLACHGKAGDGTLAAPTETGFPVAPTAARIRAKHPDLVTPGEAGAIADLLEAATHCPGDFYVPGDPAAFKCLAPGAAPSGPTPSSSSGSSTSSSGSSSTGGGTSTGGGPYEDTVSPAAALYVAQCAGCHGALGRANIQAATAARILAKHPALLTSQQADGIAAVLLLTTCSGGNGSGGGFANGIGWSCPTTAEGSSGGTDGSASSGASSSGGSGTSPAPAPPATSGASGATPPGTCLGASSGPCGSTGPWTDEERNGVGASSGTTSSSSSGTTSSSSGTTSSSSGSTSSSW